MKIILYKGSEQPKILHKISENSLYKQYLTEYKQSYKKMKVDGKAYQDLLEFHDYGQYRDYLVELSVLMRDNSIVNVPTEISSYLGHVRTVTQNIQTGQMSFKSLAPKVELDDFLVALHTFYQELSKIYCLDLTHVSGEDIFYGKKVEIFHPEYIKIDRIDARENLIHINKEIIKCIFSIDEISQCDFELDEVLDSTLNGEVGVDVLLKEISVLESKRRGKAKYLKHISNEYIK